MNRKRFSVVDGGRQAEQPRTPEPIHTCAVCNGATFIEAKASLPVKGGRIGRGLRRLLCAQCLAEGRVTTT